MAALHPKKRKKIINDFSICLMCQTESEESFTSNPQTNSLEKVILHSRQRVDYGDVEYADLVDRL